MTPAMTMKMKTIDRSIDRSIDARRRRATRDARARARDVHARAPSWTTDVARGTR